MTGREKQLLKMEDEAEKRNASFITLLDEIDDDLVLHAEIVAKIQAKAVNYDEFDFTKEVNDLMCEEIR